MNKNKFIHLLRNYHNIPTEERNKLHDLVKDYPYSQMLHVLLSKAHHDANTVIASETLHYAALYIADRTVLKRVIENDSSPYTPLEAENETDSAYDEQESPVTEIPPQEDNTFITVLPDESPISNEILADLEALKQSKASYLEWEEEHKEAKNEKTEIEETLAEEEVKPAPKKRVTKAKTTAKKTTTRKKTTAKTKAADKEKTTAKAKAAGATKKVTRKKTTAKKSKASTPESEEDLQKKEQKRKIQAEQNKIIDEFIIADPSIKGKVANSGEDQSDLSQGSTQFNEELVSENLAKILINQGKKDKAIDIYKKLIWKFPQKKAYFASCIEELKN